jgi:transcriptional regulator with XRE-family HTH domain
MSEVSNNLRTILHELNMTQVDFAKSVGISSVYINMVVNGKRHSISQPLALLIEEKYGYSAEWILYSEGEKRLCLFRTLKTYKELKTNISFLSSGEIKHLLNFILSLEENEEKKNEKRKLKKQTGRLT